LKRKRERDKAEKAARKREMRRLEPDGEAPKEPTSSEPTREDLEALGLVFGGDEEQEEA
jgi:hypothetical protein